MSDCMYKLVRGSVTPTNNIGLSSLFYSYVSYITAYRILCVIIFAMTVLKTQYSKLEAVRVVLFFFNSSSIERKAVILVNKSATKQSIVTNSVFRTKRLAQWRRDNECGLHYANTVRSVTVRPN